MMQYLLYIFDLDGTLMDSQVSIQQALQGTARDFGCSAQALKTAQSMIGMQLPQILEAMGVQDIAAAKEVYRRHYYEYVLEEKPYPGIPELLRGLHNRILLSVVTNKGKTGAHMTLDNNNLLDYFDWVQTVDDGPVKPEAAALDVLLERYRSQGKPLEPSDVLMIGDSPTDALFARNCGMDYAHVGWGFFSIDGLEVSPQYLIEKPSELLDILDFEFVMDTGPEIDLHGFLPRDTCKVLDCYLQDVHRKGMKEVRIIHGKGQGVQRARVQAYLSRRTDISGFRDAPPEQGGKGATLVLLKH